MSEEAQRLPVIKMKILTVTLFNLAVQRMCYVQNLFKVTLYFQGFSRKKVKFQFRKILVTCHTRKARKVKTSDSLLTTRKK